MKIISQDYVDLSRKSSSIVMTKYFRNLSEADRQKFRTELLDYAFTDIKTSFVTKVFNNASLELNTQSVRKSHEHLEVIRNEFDEESQGIISHQQAALQNTIVNIEGRFVNDVIDKVKKVTNAFEEEKDIISKSDKRDYEKELEIALAAFYAIVIPLFATSVLNRRVKEFGEFTNFKLNSDIKKYIKEISSKTSQSHIDTITKDLLSTIHNSYETEVERLVAEISTGRKVTDVDLKLARKKALEGKSQAQIIRDIKNEYKNISDVRAKTIARTETNRAFTQSQYQADLQFIKQNKLEGKAYKKWITRSDAPCPTCIDLASRPPVPFNENFANLGDQIITTYVEDGKTKVKTNLVNFEPLSAGNAHPNCSCIYQLIIE